MSEPTVSDLEAFGAFVRKVRERDGSTQTDIESRKGPSVKTLNLTENGKQWPTPLTIDKLQTALRALDRSDDGHILAAVFNLLAPEEQFEGGLGRHPQVSGLPRFHTGGTALTLYDITSADGPLSEDGVAVTQIAVNTSTHVDGLTRPVWPTKAWLSFVDDAMKHAPFTFMDHTPEMLTLFGPASLSHTYFQSTPGTYTTVMQRASLDYRQVAIDPTWECVSTVAARVALQELLPNESLDPWAPLVLMAAVRLALKHRTSKRQFDHLPGVEAHTVTPGPLSFLMDGGGRVAQSLRDLLVEKDLLIGGPTDATVARATTQILDAYNEVVASIVERIDLSATGDPAFSRNAVQRVEDLEGIIWTNHRAMRSARAIASAAHIDAGTGKRRGLTVTDRAITATVWEGSPAYSEPALEEVRLLEPFDDVYIGIYRGDRVAFRL